MQLHTLHGLDKTEGTVQLRRNTSSNSSSSLVLVPHPSPNDPNDPLNWPKWKKHVAFISVCAFTFLPKFGIGGLTSAFYIIPLEFNKSVSETSDLLLWPILVLGVFNFFWEPIANYFGKRPVFVLVSGLLCASYIWGATAQSFTSLSCEEQKMGLYMTFISGGNTIAPLVCGFVVTGLSWRWHKWLSVILTGVNFLTVVFFTTTSETPRVGERSQPNPTAPATCPGVPPKILVTRAYSLVRSPPDGTNPLLLLFLRPLPMFIYPPVIYALLTYAVSLVLTVSVNILNPFVLQAPPYSWPPSKNGLINIPGFLGNLTGSYCGGRLVDLFCDWKARRSKNGIFEPESRLYLLALPLLITGAGCVLFGCGVERTLHWTSYSLSSKNIIAFGFLHGIVPWVEKVRYPDCFGVQAGILIAVIAVGMAILIPFGAKIRHRQARSRIIL
ncbi:protein HOL1 [Cladorrhinum sp. PSN259]|nr:protein HOL1 [Cladorrhinum sp. PSN259]